MTRDGPGSATLIHPIQYLRGIAALMVVWHHALEQLPGLSAHFPLRFGTSGVDLFFVISGFIMVVTTFGKSVTPAQFLARRLVRVGPLYWVLTCCLVAMVLVAPSLFRSVHLTPGHLAQSLLFIPHLSPSHPGMIWPVLVPGWTLNYEMFFYAVFAAALVFRHSLPVLVGTLSGLVAAGYLFGPFDNAIAQTYTDPILLEFVLGAVVGRLWLAGVALSFPTSFVAMAIGTVCLLLRDMPPLGIYTQLAGAVLVVCGALNDRFAAKRSALLLLLGDASYSIYLTHLFALGVLRWAWSASNLAVSSTAAALSFMGLGLACSAIVGWLVYRWVEVPLLARMRAFRTRAEPSKAHGF